MKSIEKARYRKVPGYFAQPQFTNKILFIKPEEIRTFRNNTEVNRGISQAPQRHLIGLDDNNRLSRDFVAWATDRTTLHFVIVSLQDTTNKHHHDVLAVVDISQPKAQLEQSDIWVFLDDQGRMILCTNSKHSTLCAPFLEDEATYANLSGFTCSWYDYDHSHPNKPDRISLDSKYMFVALVESFQERLAGFYLPKPDQRPSLVP